MNFLCYPLQTALRLRFLKRLGRATFCSVENVVLFKLLM